jgi:hypothetical protein
VFVFLNKVNLLFFVMEINCFLRVTNIIFKYYNQKWQGLHRLILLAVASKDTKLVITLINRFASVFNCASFLSFDGVVLVHSG